MNRKTRMLRVFALLISCCIAAHCFGQGAKLQLDNLNKLGDKAARVTDVTLDGSLLNFAVSLIEKMDDEGDKDVAQLKSIIKGLQGIYVKSFEFDEPGQYSKADVEAIRAQLATPRWTRIVQSTDKHANEHDEIYLLKNGEHVAGVTILVAEARELTVVNIVGEVPIDKIAALERHFGGEKNSSKSKHKKESGHDDE
jgi:hypothetical protein